MSLLERKISVVNPIAIPRNIFPNPLSDRNPPLSQTLAVVFAIGYAGEGDREEIRKNIKLLGESDALSALKGAFLILHRTIELRYIDPKTSPFGNIAGRLGEEFSGKFYSDNVQVMAKTALEWLKNYVLIEESGGFERCIAQILSDKREFDAPNNYEVLFRLRKFAAQRGGEPTAITFLLHQKYFRDFVQRIDLLLQSKVPEAKRSGDNCDILLSNLHSLQAKTRVADALETLDELHVIDELKAKNLVWHRIIELRFLSGEFPSSEDILDTINREFSSRYDAQKLRNQESLALEWLTNIVHERKIDLSSVGLDELQNNTLPDTYADDAHAPDPTAISERIRQIIVENFDQLTSSDSDRQIAEDITRSFCARINVPNAISALLKSHTLAELEENMAEALADYQGNRTDRSEEEFKSSLVLEREAIDGRTKSFFTTLTSALPQYANDLETARSLVIETLTFQKFVVNSDQGLTEEKRIIQHQQISERILDAVIDSWGTWDLRDHLNNITRPDWRKKAAGSLGTTDNFSRVEDRFLINFIGLSSYGLRHLARKDNRQVQMEVSNKLDSLVIVAPDKVRATSYVQFLKARYIEGRHLGEIAEEFAEKGVPRNIYRVVDSMRDLIERMDSAAWSFEEAERVTIHKVDRDKLDILLQKSLADGNFTRITDEMPLISQQVIYGEGFSTRGKLSTDMLEAEEALGIIADSEIKNGEIAHEALLGLAIGIVDKKNALDEFKQKYFQEYLVLSLYLGVNSEQLLDSDEIARKINKEKSKARTNVEVDEAQVIELRNQAVVLLRTYCAENSEKIMGALSSYDEIEREADATTKVSDAKESADAISSQGLYFTFIEKPIIPEKKETIALPSRINRREPLPPPPRPLEHLLLDHRQEGNRPEIKIRLQSLVSEKPEVFEELRFRDSTAYTALLAGFSLNGSSGTPNYLLEARALTRLRALILPSAISNVVLPTSESLRSSIEEEHEERSVRRRSKIKDEGSQEISFEEPVPKRVAPVDEEVETQDGEFEGESLEEDGNHEESGNLEPAVLPHGSSDLDQISFDPDLDVGDDELELPEDMQYPGELRDRHAPSTSTGRKGRSADYRSPEDYQSQAFVHKCAEDGTLEKLKGIDKRAYETLKIKYGDEVEVIINSAVGVELAKLEGKEKSIDQSTVGVICRRGLEKLQQLVRGEEIASVHTRSHFQKLPGQAVRVEAIQSPPSALQSETTRPTVILRRPATIVSSVSSPIPSPVSTASSPITNPPVQVTALTNTELVEVLSLDSNITDNIKRKKDVLLRLEKEGQLIDFQTCYPREYSVIKFRYFGNKVMEYDRIANELSKVEHGKMLTEERIRQIEKQALKHLINQLSGVTVQPVSEPKIEVGVKQIAPVLTKEKEEILVVLNGSRHTQEKQYVLRNVLLQLETQGYLEILAGTDQRYATYLVDRYLKDEKIKPLEEMAKLLGVKSTGTVEKIEQKSLYAISELVRYDSNSISVVTSELTLSADKKSNRARIRQVLLKIHRTGWLEELKIISEKQYLTLILRHGLNGSTALKMVDTRVKLAELTGKSEPYGLTTILIHEQSAIKNVVAILERKMKEGIINVGRGSKVDTRSLKLAVGVSGVEVGTEKIPRLQDPRPLIPDQPFTAPSSGQPFVESLARIPEPVPVLQSHRLHSILGETNPRVFMGKILNGTAPDVLAMIKSGFGNGTTNLEVAAILREEAAHIKIIGANAFWMQGGGKPHTLIGPAVNNPASVLQSKAAEIESLQI